MTGRGAVGCPFITFIKSGSAKNPAKAKNKRESLLKVASSLNESDPYKKIIIPITVSPNTKANCSNITTASSDGTSPKASVISIILNSGENNEIISGNTCKAIITMFILKIVLIFISIRFVISLNQYTN